MNEIQWGSLTCSIYFEPGVRQLWSGVNHEEQCRSSRIMAIGMTGRPVHGQRLREHVERSQQMGNDRWN